jgi:hypothetical protein
MTTEGLAATAARVRDFGLKITADLKYDELHEVWRRLPNVTTTSPPAGQRTLAERIALYAIELGWPETFDFKAYIGGHPPVREIPAPTDRVTNHETEGLTMTETATAEAGKPRIPAPKKTPKPPAAAKGTTTATPAGAPKKAPKTAAKAPKAAARGVGTGKSKTAAPGTPKAASKPASGPRSGSITGLVVEKTKLGWGVEAIAKFVAKEHAGTTFAEEVKNEDYHAVGWYQGQARKKGWLPKV